MKLKPLDETDDPELAAFMRKHCKKAPVEKIVGTDILSTSFNRDKLRAAQRVVNLACGHQAVTTYSRKRVPCKLCHEMILNGGDYEAWRFRR